MNGLVAIYRWRVDAEHEQAFIARWERATRHLAQRGGLGSLIGKNAAGELVAVALWPDQAAREKAFAEGGDEEPWPPAERLEPMLIDPIHDMWRLDQWQEITR